MSEQIIIGSLMLTDAGTPRANLANCITTLRYHHEWIGVLAFNEFTGHVTTQKFAPWQASAGANWTDYDDSLTTDWMQRIASINVNTRVIAEAVQTVARDNSFHPVRDYLKSLKWDQQPRIDRWLTTYLGAGETVFSKAIGARWLISAVARIMRPGCQVDHALVLEGPQGIRKSTALRILASDEWFADHISDLGGKDSRIELHAKWILELAELDRVRRAELERTKAFLTARSDHFRPPYGRRAEDVPRQCVFAASINDDVPFTDETGNRRFWPIRCGRIDIDSLARDRDQIWGEAYQRYCDGAVWWLDTEELNALAAKEQEERYDAGIWDDVILQWAFAPTQREEQDGQTRIPITPFDSTSGRVTVADVLLHAIGKPLKHCTQGDKNAVARCLIHDGWKRKQDRGKSRGMWFYMRAGRNGNQ